MAEPKLLSCVALLKDLPEHDLSRGAVGTIVERLADNVFEVEFSDLDGRSHAMVPLERESLLELHYDPSKAAA